MTTLSRLDQWKQAEIISGEQHQTLSALTRGEPTSVFLELNVLLYAGILAFVGGLGWTVSTWSQQLGDIVVIALLSAALAGCLWYCFSHAPPWSRSETASAGLLLDYTLYFAGLLWSVELAYIEKRLHLLSGQWDGYLLVTAALFFFLAYRFDNRFVLSLALSALAGWFGIAISHWHTEQDSNYRQLGMLYAALVAGGGVALRQSGLKPHFFGTYLNIAANVLFWALVSGAVQREDSGLWLFLLFAACAASLLWGLKRREFSFVAYAALYGYVGLSASLLRGFNSFEGVLSYFLFTGTGMIVVLVLIARKFGREA